MLTGAGLPPRIMIDASHANSRKVPARQIDVVNDIAAQVGRGNEDIFGVMIESNLVEGRQDVLDGQPPDLWAEHYRCVCGLERYATVVRELSASG
ncbi:MAG: hypothetical protein CM15mP120_29460 [Pseudomonadota bacterium]|nr:MAG: hypothetical protein CM15mP120_29460 [Pseudomonadota bacterium]